MAKSGKVLFFMIRDLFKPSGRLAVKIQKKKNLA